MKKTIAVASIVCFVLLVVLISFPKHVQAEYSATKQCLAAGGWNAGTEVDVDLTSAPAPEWLQLMTTSAVVITEPTEICHELGGGKFHWVGEIRQLKGDKWVKLDTINDWATDEEGAYMSCALAPSAGTYALFAYYNGPQEFFYEVPSCGVNEVYNGTYCVCDEGYEFKNGGCSLIKPTKLE